MPFQTVSRTSTGGYICDLIVHPLSGKRSPMEKGLALIAVIALSIFAVRFFFNHLGNFEWRNRTVQPNTQPNDIGSSGKNIRGIADKRIQGPMAKDVFKENLGERVIEHGIDQQTYPPNTDRLQACTCHSVAAILYLRDNLASFQEALESKNGGSIQRIHEAIISKGLTLWEKAHNDHLGCSNEGISLEGELEDYVEESKELRGQCETFFINNCNDLGRELEHIFPRELNSYALVETPGMTFPLFGLGGDKAYLFDPHIKWSAIISQDEARSYFGHVMLQLSDKPGEYDNLKALHFYYGE